MKTKMTLLILLTAIVTFSFTFVATRKDESNNVQPVAKTVENEPIGGLVSEDNL